MPRHALATPVQPSREGKRETTGRMPPQFSVRCVQLLLLGVGLPLLLLHSWTWPEPDANLTLEEAVAGVAVNKTVIVCIVSSPYLPFLNNWLISVARQGRHQAVLVMAEDTATLDTVRSRWPGHAVLIPPAIAASSAHKFGSQGFFNLTSRRPRHLLRILELGYSVLYNDADMVWLADPFPFFLGPHDVFFADDIAAVKPQGHPSALPPPGKKGRPYICSCLLFLRPSPGSKLLLRAWIQEMEQQPWSPQAKVNDQPAFNWALMKTAGRVDVHVLPQAAFPTGGLYFKNKTWRKQTQGEQVVLHNNYLTGFEKKITRFREHGLWYQDGPDAALSPLRISEERLVN